MFVCDLESLNPGIQESHLVKWMHEIATTTVILDVFHGDESGVDGLRRTGEESNI